MATQNAISLTASGLASYDGAGTFAGRTIQQPAAGITVSNGDGVSGDPTLALADDLAAVEALSGSGVVTRTGASSWATNTIADRAIVAGDAGNTVQGIGPLSDGELVIGATGGDPAAATLTAGTSIAITNATNSVTINLDVPVTEVNGGTNQTTYATGDILYASGANTLSKLSAGTNADVLTLAAGVPSWAAPVPSVAEGDIITQVYLGMGS